MSHEFKEERFDDIDIETFLNNSDEEGYRTTPKKIMFNTFITSIKDTIDEKNYK
ncbi:8060_t:CDS:2 [Diversispora eburnea]|uniref:8060_t:CDS:1 n=1 Tax=Diversispora eburnea TaxID=1213867 RepID=A0A9N8WLI1_9GLOM|nr:8060_t:CDS:2 [Diversispora eburnea]